MQGSSTEPQCINCSSKNCFINKYGDRATRRMLSKKKSFAIYKKGDVIIRQGAPVSGIYFIFEGKTKVFISGPREQVQIVRLAGSGNILGHRGIGEKLVYPIGAAALDDSKICFIPIPVFMDALQRNPKLTLHLVMLYADEMKKSEYKLLYSNQMTVRERIAHTLLYLSDVFGHQKIKGMNYLRVPISRKEISQIIGASIEEVIRTLSLLNKEGIIKIDSRRIAIQKMSELNRIIEDFPVF